MSRRRIVVIAVACLLLAVVLVGLLLVPALLGVVWLPAQGGWCFVSERYDWNNNESYEVVFHSVRFTYLYSTHPTLWLPNYPYTAYFLVRFEDGSVEDLTLEWGYASVNPSWGVTSVHQFPRVGVMTGNTADFSGDSWRFTVTVSA